jgi:hypothetical protein
MLKKKRCSVWLSINILTQCEFKKTNTLLFFYIFFFFFFFLKHFYDKITSRDPTRDLPSASTAGQGNMYDCLQALEIRDRRT